MKKINLAEIIKKCRALDAQELMQYFKLHSYKFYSWGANGFTHIEGKCLKFKTNGHHHKGHVYIVVNGADLFDVYLTTTQGNIKEELKDIFIEDLFNTLDKKIEFIKEYTH